VGRGPRPSVTLVQGGDFSHREGGWEPEITGGRKAHGASRPYARVQAYRLQVQHGGPGSARPRPIGRAQPYAAAQAREIPRLVGLYLVTGPGGLWLVAAPVGLWMVVRRDGLYVVSVDCRCGPFIHPRSTPGETHMKGRCFLLCALVLAACTQSPTASRTPDAGAQRDETTSSCEKGGMTMGGGQFVPCP
jgi:hypothetical protein